MILLKKLIIHFLTGNEIPDVDPDKKLILPICRVCRIVWGVIAGAGLGFIAYCCAGFAFIMFDESFNLLGLGFAAAAIVCAVVAVYTLIRCTGRLDEAERRVMKKIDFTYRKK